MGWAKREISELAQNDRKWSKERLMSNLLN